MYVRSRTRPDTAAWYVSRLSMSGPYSMMSGRMLCPVRQKRCWTRATSSSGRAGRTQKSS